MALTAGNWLKLKNHSIKQMVLRRIGNPSEDLFVQHEIIFLLYFSADGKFRGQMVNIFFQKHRVEILIF